MKSKSFYKRSIYASLLALVWIGMAAGCGWGGPKINLGPYEALGAITAEETSKLMGHKGKLVMGLEDPGEGGDPVMDAQMGAFRAALASQGSVTVAGVETVKMEPLQRMATGGAMPPDAFMKLLEAHPAVDAVVLFMGFPALSSAQLEALRQRSIKVIVASACLPGYRQLLKKGVIHLALVPRVGEAPDLGKEKTTLRDWFNEEYVIGTPENAEAAPY